MPQRLIFGLAPLFQGPPRARAASTLHATRPRAPAARAPRRVVCNARQSCSSSQMVTPGRGHNTSHHHPRLQAPAPRLSALEGLPQPATALPTQRGCEGVNNTPTATRRHLGEMAGSAPLPSPHTVGWEKRTAPPAPGAVSVSAAAGCAPGPLVTHELVWTLTGPWGGPG